MGRLPLIKGIFEKGFGIIPRQPLQDERLSKNAKLIYSYFASYVSSIDNNEAFPGYKLVCQHLGITKETFFLNLKILMAYGYIQKEKREKSNANRYILNPFPEDNEKLLREIKLKKEKIKLNNKLREEKLKAKILKNVKNDIKNEGVINNQEHRGIINNQEHSVINNQEHSVINNQEHSVINNQEPINNNKKQDFKKNNNNRKKNDTREEKKEDKLKNKSKEKKEGSNSEKKSQKEKENVKGIEEYENIENITKSINNKIGIIKKEKVIDLIKVFGSEKVIFYINNFKYFKTGKHNPVGFFIKAIKHEYSIPKEQKNTYNGNKPVQSTNFDQREYDDDFFEGLYDNFRT